MTQFEMTDRRRRRRRRRRPKVVPRASADFVRQLKAYYQLGGLICIP